MNKSKSVNLKITKFLRSAVCFGALSLIFVSNAFAGGGSTTPPPCGEWNEIGTFRTAGSTKFLGYVTIQVDKGKPAVGLAGVEMEAKKGTLVSKGTTDHRGIIQFRIPESGSWKFTAKKSGHLFSKDLTYADISTLEASLCR